MGQGRAEGVGGSARPGQDPGAGPAPLLRTRGGGRGEAYPPRTGRGSWRGPRWVRGRGRRVTRSYPFPLSLPVPDAAAPAAPAAGRRLDRGARAVVAAAAAAEARPPRLDPLPGGGDQGTAGWGGSRAPPPAGSLLSPLPAPGPEPAHLIWGPGKKGGQGRRSSPPPPPLASGAICQTSHSAGSAVLPPHPPCAPPSRASRARPPPSLRTFGIAVERREGGTQSLGAAASCGRPSLGGRLRASSPGPPSGPPPLPPAPQPGSGGAAAVAVAGGASCRGGSSRRPGAQQVRAASSPPLLLLFLRSPAPGSSQWRPCSAGPAPAPLPLPAQSDSGHRLLAAPLSGCLCPPPGPGALRTPAAFCSSLAGTHLGHPATEAGWLLTPSSLAAEGVGRSLYCVCLWGAGGVTEFPGTPFLSSCSWRAGTARSPYCQPD